MRYSSDYNYVRSDGKCVPSGPERIPNTQCTLGTPGEKYMGSSGYRKIPGNKCEGGSRMDEPMSKIVPEMGALEAVEDLCLVRHLQLNLSKERSFTRLYVFCSSFFPVWELMIL